MISETSEKWGSHKEVCSFKEAIVFQERKSLERNKKENKAKELELENDIPG